MTLALVHFLVGLALLIGGAEILVRGAAGLALRLGLTPLVVGLTVVAFATSAPEVAVSLRAALAGRPEIALGNAVGSNVFNILFVLGLSALVTPLVVSRRLVRLDVPVMIGVSLLVWAMALDGRITRFEGSLLAAGLVVYTWVLIRMSRRANSRDPGEGTERRPAADGIATPPAGSGLRASLGFRLLLVLGGTVLLVLGSRWLVDGAREFAEAWGVSELVVGLTIVAAGTSLPEAATSVLASMRGHRDMAVGNVVGSNLFNLLGALGLAAVFSPAGVAVPPAALSLDLPVMTAVAVACLPVFFTGYVIARWEGAVFLLYYGAYTLYLVLASARHEALPVFSGVMLAFVVPLTVLTLVVVLWREFAARSAARETGR